MVDLAAIRAARQRIGDALETTPTVPDHALGDRLGRSVRIKAELLQRTGAFKPRGALNWIRSASREELAPGLVTVSAGNHAAALAWAARAAGVKLTVVMPEAASPFKVDATRHYGAEVILHGDINDALALLDRKVREDGLTLVHPYDDPRIIAGQGTVGLEILEQAPDTGTILCPVGGGGLISGIAIAVKQLQPDIRIIGVEAEGAPTLAHAWHEGGPTRLERIQTMAASLGAAIAGEHTYRLSRQYVDELIRVPEGSIREGVRHLLARAKLHAEPGAAVTTAALLDGTVDPDTLPETGDIVTVVTGGNMSTDELRSML